MEERKLMLPRKERAKNYTERKYYFTYFRRGLKLIKEDKALLVKIFVMDVAFEILLWCFVCQSPRSEAMIAKLLFPGELLSTTVLVIVLTLILIYLIGSLDSAIVSDAKLLEAGFTSGFGDAPTILEYSVDKDGIQTRLYDSAGIPLHIWQDKIPYLEAALNVTIIDIDYDEGKTKIKIRCVGAGEDYKEKNIWRGYEALYNYEYAVGETAGKWLYHINIDQTPMVLIGGATGSGKSIMLKCLLLQAIDKKEKVFIADFKGGLDYNNRLFNKYTTIVESHDDLEALLKDMCHELEKRKQIYKEMCVDNYMSYYYRAGATPLRRIILAFDEVAEALDTRGSTKEQKEQIQRIIAYMSTIARLGRAFGIHMFLATQRPDANIIPGQIKNNCQARICGACDQMLSQIILDCSDASDQIPKNRPGRFMMHDKKIVQGFYIEDEYYERKANELEGRN